MGDVSLGGIMYNSSVAITRCSVQEEREKLTFGLYLRFWKFL